eukprot:gnl/MRDRNA2_/MRDRNA2_101081_c0_seq1.p1 gnl/MRDRNA2_/MRDRNA2_101081_c0~~gnl/MRDRNA2_/MRDRNA2_101081_c0_seq1.p1  ORF type:complete len:270 (-),score=60.22 gnl/MRDRNA2_/MRDRNA2_101081_c0_seq1:26-835(-)
MARYARLPLLLICQHLLAQASPLRRARAPARSMLQDQNDLDSKTVVTKTIVTTITTQTQETKTVVTKEKPTEDSEPTRLDNESNGRQSMLPLAEGSTPMAEVFAQMRRAAPRAEVETIRFPSSPESYFGKDSHGDTGMGEDNIAEQSQSEQAPHSSDLGGQEVKDQEEPHHEPQHFPKAKPDTSLESKQDHIAETLEKNDLKKSGDSPTKLQSFLGDAPTRLQSFISLSEGSDSGFQMLPAACRLLFFLVGVVVVFLLACGFASAALLG